MNKLSVKIALVGNEGVGKSTLLNSSICNLFAKGCVKRQSNTNYLGIANTNVGEIELEIIVISEISLLSELNKNEQKTIDCAIIMSDISDANIATSFKKWYDEITLYLGNNVKIINCFNKIDIKDKDTYIFDTALPSFDISARHDTGVCAMITFALRISLRHVTTRTSRHSPNLEINIV
jgi:GTPase SAR1 family protein